MAQSLQGKIAFITGAARGIGKATAIALANEGVHIGLIARNEATLQTVAEELKALGVNTAYASANVADIAEVETAIASLTEQLGAADILINNAGIGKFASVLDMDPAEWKEIVDVNLFGTYNVTRTVLPQLIEKNGGDIINISSTAGLGGAATSSAYSASKFGVIGLTESLAQEVRRHNIRVTALTPSTVVTDLARDMNLIDESKEERLMQAEDMAELIVAQLKLNKRVYLKNATMITTNPF